MLFTEVLTLGGLGCDRFVIKSGTRGISYRHDESYPEVRNVGGGVSINQRNDSDVILMGPVRGVKVLSTFTPPNEFRVFYGSSNECFPGKGTCSIDDISSVVNIIAL